MGYTVHRYPDTEMLCSLRVGDKVKINGNRTALTVYGVNHGFVVAANMAAGDNGRPRYTIISKDAARQDFGERVKAGKPFCGTDPWDAETDPADMQFDQPEATEKYLRTLTVGERTIGRRTAETIKLLMVKRAAAQA